MITTKGMSVPEALRTIAGWIDDGCEVEVRYETESWRNPPHSLRQAGAIWDLSLYEYRAKPRKPRRLKLPKGWFLTDEIVWVIEETPEVRERCADLLEDV